MSTVCPDQAVLRGSRIGEELRRLLQSRMRAVAGGRTAADGARIALVIEGGGMRGVIAGGMVTAIQELGLLGCFDLIVGTSAGAAAGAYLSAGQARLGTSIFFEDINNRRFIDFRRFAARRPIMDIGFLVDTVFRQVKPLDVEAIRHAECPLYFVATNVADGQAHLLRAQALGAQFWSGLRASMTLPLLAGPSVEVDGIGLVDGGVTAPIALEQAFALGATHALVLVTRTLRRDHRPGPSPRAWALDRMLRRRYSPRVAEAFAARGVIVGRVVRRLRAHVEGAAVEAAIGVISLDSPCLAVGRTTTDGAALRSCAVEAHAEAARALGDCLR